jgi:hypothetical protein
MCLLEQTIRSAERLAAAAVEDESLSRFVRPQERAGQAP